MNLSDAERAFLDSHRIGHLATADAGGAPHVIPICYARVGDLLYCVADDKPKRHGPRDLKRLANIAANPRAALVIDDYDEDWSRLAYLLLHLEAALVETESEYAVAIEALRRRYPPYRTMDLRPDAHPMVRLRPYRSHFWRAVTTA